MIRLSTLCASFALGLLLIPATLYGLAVARASVTEFRESDQRMRTWQMARHLDPEAFKGSAEVSKLVFGPFYGPWDKTADLRGPFKLLKLRVIDK